MLLTSPRCRVTCAKHDDGEVVEIADNWRDPKDSRKSLGKRGKVLQCSLRPRLQGGCSVPRTMYCALAQLRTGIEKDCIPKGSLGNQIKYN